MSFHDSDPDLPSAGDELKLSIPVIKELEKMFPKMDLLDSNHGSLVYRRAFKHGIPRAYIKEYNDFLEVGKGWKWHDDLVIDTPLGTKIGFVMARQHRILLNWLKAWECHVFKDIIIALGVRYLAIV